MRKLLFIAGLLVSQVISAQNHVKILTPNYKNEITGAFGALPVVSGSTSPENGYYAAFKARNSQNIQVDANGKIQFFIVDGYVYDRKGRFIGNVAESVTSAAAGFSQGMYGETMIVPSGNVCDHDQTFFLFSTYKLIADDAGGSLASYDRITVAYDQNDNLVSGSGLLSATVPDSELDQFEIATLVGSVFYDQGSISYEHCQRPLMAATKDLGGKRFIYIQNIGKIFRLKIANNTLVYDNYYVDLTDFYSSLTTCETDNRSEMELVSMANGNLRLAFPVETNSEIGFSTLDFSSSTGDMITGSLKMAGYITTSGQALKIKGAELSPSGERLYLTHNPVPSYYTSTLDMFDLTVSTPVKYPLSTVSDYQDSQIESGMGDVLLIPSTSSLSKILSSNSLAPTISSYVTLSSYSATCPYTTCSAQANVRLMQDQIDGEDYLPNGDFYSYTVTTSGTWTPTSNPISATDTIYIRDELRIMAGVDLTISGMQIYFGPNARLIVENGFTTPFFSLTGGKLTLDNTTLTADLRCDNNAMWFGVEVWGNSTSAQGTITTSQQGRLVMNNSSRIKNALYGASARATDPVTLAEASARYGGIIQATNSFFENNQNDILLTNYVTANSLSKFTNCEFFTGSLLNDPSLDLGNHIALFGVQGVYIRGCDFRNDAMDLYSIDKQGIGIYALNSNFYALSFCNVVPPLSCVIPNDPNQFVNLTNGILSQSLWSTLTFQSDGSIFQNNVIGVSVAGTENISLIRNKFYVREITSSEPIINQAAGISLAASTGYQIEENLFEEYDDPLIFPGSGNTYGIVVNASGEANNKIYRNKFSKLKIGGQSEAINGSVQVGGNGTGLEWKCNQFNARVFSYDLTVMDGRVSYHQGHAISSDVTSSRLAAANNKFSSNNESAAFTHDFYVSPASTSNNINYIQYLNQDYYDLDSYTTSKIAVSDAVALGSPITYTAAGCPSNFFDGQVFLSPVEGSEESASDNGNIAAKSMVERDDREAYLQTVADEARRAKIREILADNAVSDKNKALTELLSGEKGLESRQFLAELQLLETGSISESLASGLSGDFLKLMEVKKQVLLPENFMAALTDKAQKDFLEKSLIPISQNKEDVLTAGQAKIMLSLMQPRNLTFHFMEIEGSTAETESMENSSVESIEIYPNPAKDRLTISMKIEDDKTVTAKVYTVLGNAVATWKVDSGKKSFEIGHLNTGVYLVHLTDQNGAIIKTLKFVKE